MSTNIDEEAEPAEAGGLNWLDELLISPKRRLRDLPGLTIGAIQLVWSASRREFVITTALQIVGSASTAVQLLISRRLLTLLLPGHAHSDSGAVPYVIALGVLIAIAGVTSVTRSELQAVMNELVGRYSMRKVVEISTVVDLIAFENPAFHNRQERALVNAASRPIQMTTGISGFIGGMVSTIGVGVALLIVQPLFVLLAIIAIIPIWIATVASSRAMYEYAVEQTELDRRRLYLQMILTDKATAKEIRAYDTVDFLSDRFNDLYNRRIDAIRRLVKVRLRQGVLGAALTGLLTAVTLAIIVLLLSEHKISLADAGLVAGALVVLSSQLQGLASAAGQLYESSLFIRDFVDFVEVAPELLRRRGKQEVPERLERFEARDVGFTYPSRTEPSLRNVSLSIPRGAVVALVGENGSGKTTLAKLMAGLFPASSGGVYWDDYEVGELEPSAARARAAVLFQDFVRYHLTARENIALGNRLVYDDADAVTRAAQSAGADDFLSRLPSGYETLLAAEFYGGSDLSGGQWQRIALARAFLRDAELIILDEPTASLDPRSEAQLFSQVRDLFVGRTVILISHRFVSVRHADQIFVLDEGQIVERGSHDELMAEGGKYAELYQLQAQAYEGNGPGTVTDGNIGGEGEEFEW